MSTINEKLVAKLANLARLKLSSNEVVSMTTSLSGIFNHVESLMQLDVEDIDPLTHVHPDSISYRSDQVSEFSNKQSILDNIPDRSGNFIRVPLIIESES